MLALLVGPVAGAARAAEVRSATEYQLKAAFLYNFAKFVEWPPAAFPTAGTPLRFCVLGPEAFATELERTVAGETVGGRDLAVRRIRRPADLEGCHVLFVGAMVREPLEALAAVASGSVLTVGESEGFLAAGGIINFFIDGNRVRFEIAPAAAERAGLKISSKLLKLARIVREPS